MTSLLNPEGNGTSHIPIQELASSMGGHGSTLLAVWAHPDDESLLAAGLMAAFARRGGRVVSVSATLGEHGTSDPLLHPPSRLARRRSRELARALDRLGAEPPVFFGEEDGKCSEVSVADGVARVGSVLDVIKPDVVLSFGPGGVTGHPDHRAVARWTAGAVADHSCELPLVTTEAALAWPDDVIAAMHRIDAFYSGAPVTRSDDGCLHARVSGWPLQQKLAALSSHRSQMGPLHAELGDTGLRRMASFEAYRPLNAPAAALLATQGALTAA